MPEYVFYGNLSLSNVAFFITAENEEEAESKARAGQFDDWEVGGASSDDVKIDPKSLELNE